MTLRLREFLPYRLNRLASEMSQQIRAVYIRTVNLTMPEWRVLATLAERSPMTAREIGGQTYLHKTKVSRAVRSLEDRRWLRREINDQDRREEWLSLTAAGQAGYASIAPKLEAFQAEVLAKLAGHEVEILDALAKLEDAIGIVRSEGSPVSHSS